MTVRSGVSILAALGAAIGSMSARAMSHPANPNGWDGWNQDPWTIGVILGFGSVIFFLLRFARTSAERTTSRIPLTISAAIIGFVLSAPAGPGTDCIEGAGGTGRCSTEQWSTMTGINSWGDWIPWVAVWVAVSAAVVVWAITSRPRPE